jgi:hypothetical protein
MSEKIDEAVKCNGYVKLIIEDLETGKQTLVARKNTVLNGGKAASASCLANNIGTTFNFYLTTLLVGTNGVSGGEPKVVAPSRTGLFGPTLLTKPVSVSIDPANSNLLHVTSVLSSSDGNGNSLSEIALVLASGTTYSMFTFPVITKTSSMQITVVWDLEFV